MIAVFANVSGVVLEEHRNTYKRDIGITRNISIL